MGLELTGGCMLILSAHSGVDGVRDQWTVTDITRSFHEFVRFEDNFFMSEGLKNPWTPLKGASEKRTT